MPMQPIVVTLDRDRQHRALPSIDCGQGRAIPDRVARCIHGAVRVPPSRTVTAAPRNVG
jgi:hypothetical protein